MTMFVSAALPPGLVDAVQRRLAAEHLSPEPTILADAVRAESVGVIDDARMVDLIRGLEQELTGCGPLTVLLADPATTDVVVNAPDDVRVDRGCGWETTGIRFADDAAVQRLARRLATLVGARLDDAHPYVDGRLPDGTRLHAVLPPVASSGSCLSLRVLRPARYDLGALDMAGLFPGLSGVALRAMIAARLAFLVCGGTGSGKTTLLGALLAEVSADERIVTVEDAEELRPVHPHVVRLVARAANVEGIGAIGLAELVRQALRMRPDRLVVGEVRGAEVVDLLAALSTGHEGGAGTVHANSAQDVPSRITSLAQTAGMSQEAAHAQLAGAVQVVVHLKRQSGVRRVADIAVLEPTREGGVRAVSAVINGQLTPDGAPKLADMLRVRGARVPW
ncbi:MAG: TadA family conjugal transfer-associated ATPase [Nakamurella sp.]